MPEGDVISVRLYLQRTQDRCHKILAHQVIIVREADELASGTVQQFLAQRLQWLAIIEQRHYLDLARKPLNLRQQHMHEPEEPLPAGSQGRAQDTPPHAMPAWMMPSPKAPCRFRQDCLARAQQSWIAIHAPRRRRRHSFLSATLLSITQLLNRGRDERPTPAGSSISIAFDPPLMLFLALLPEFPGFPIQSSRWS